MTKLTVVQRGVKALETVGEWQTPPWVISLLRDLLSEGKERLSGQVFSASFP